LFPFLKLSGKGNIEIWKSKVVEDCFRFLPSVEMTGLLKDKKGAEEWAATPPTLLPLSSSCGRHSDRREESRPNSNCNAARNIAEFIILQNK